LILQWQTLFGFQLQFVSLNWHKHGQLSKHALVFKTFFSGNHLVPKVWILIIWCFGAKKSVERNMQGFVYGILSETMPVLFLYPFTALIIISETVLQFSHTHFYFC